MRLNANTLFLLLVGIALGYLVLPRVRAATGV